ncbi:hypothetical protein CCR94_17315 [Rhodoblastus sphagnicola]|uniref:DNA-binding protein n=1 Tax=Rhodoblastus sphagnicola TaxID=333368 RepID=A0A2S6N1V8_9HYPH|nr:hypothetical protein [Rhodoblastus sphagnicola]MBB4198251.1 hypothetical protein [Rhodoblastus sphagnicola]PPQ28603.1 hypothetical protein CCR94_17315 [Rhodoblastus sphagnicola]
MKQDHKKTSISGLVTAVFARRFVVEDKDGKHLADLGSQPSLVDLREGDKVTLQGRRKHAEIKVSAITKKGGEMILIARKGGHGHDKTVVSHDPSLAIAAVKLEGYRVLGAPLGTPDHFEILGRSAKGKLVEFHVELDGAIDSKKPADMQAPKWASAIADL